MTRLNQDPPRILSPLAFLERGRQLFSHNLTRAMAIPLAAIGPLAAFGALAFAGPAVLLPTAEKALGHPPELVVGAIIEGYFGIVSITFILLMPALIAGVAACFLGGIRSGSLTADRLGDGFRNWWSCTWVVWLLECGTAVSMPLVAILIGVPGVYGLQALIWLALFRIVDRQQGGVEALAFAWRVMRSNWLMLTVSTFVMITLVAAGVLVVVGIATIVPVIAGALAAAYDDLSTRDQAPRSPPDVG
jgi:hypothetical protein